MGAWAVDILEKEDRNHPKLYTDRILLAGQHPGTLPLFLCFPPLLSLLFLDFFQLSPPFLCIHVVIIFLLVSFSHLLLSLCPFSLYHLPLLSSSNFVFFLSAPISNLGFPSLPSCLPSFRPSFLLFCFFLFLVFSTLF